MRFGIDIDGVMYQWSKTARFMLREILPNSPYTKDGPLGTESLSWEYIHDNISSEHWKWLWTEGVRLGLFRYGHIYPGTIKAICRLSEMGDVIAITHRPKSAVEDTMAWLSYHRLPLAGIHIMTNQENKATVARCDYYIDDKPENCMNLQCAHPTAVVAIPTRPWNLSWYAGAHKVVRVNSWDDFINLVTA